MAETKELSIIIANHNTKDYLHKCINSFYTSQDNHKWEVIVVDNNSIDGSAEMISQEYPDIKLICLDENIGYSKANNIGIKNAKSEFVLLLNSDTIISPESIKKMLSYGRQNGKFGGIGCKQLDGNNRLQLSWGKFPTFTSEIVRKFLHSKLSLNDSKIREYLENRFNGTEKVGWVSGSCFMTKKSILQEVGLFDSRFFLYFEDVDLCHRIRKTNREIYYNSEIEITHFGGITARQNLARAYIEYRKSQVYFCRKYYGRLGAAALKTLIFMKFSLIGLLTGLRHLCHGLAHEPGNCNCYTKLLLCKKNIEVAIKS